MFPSIPFGVLLALSGRLIFSQPHLIAMGRLGHWLMGGDGLCRPSAGRNDSHVREEEGSNLTPQGPDMESQETGLLPTCLPSFQPLVCQTDSRCMCSESWFSQDISGSLIPSPDLPLPVIPL